MRTKWFSADVYRVPYERCLDFMWMKHLSRCGRLHVGICTGAYLVYISLKVRRSR